MTTFFIADTHFGEQPKARERATGLNGDDLDRLIEQRWRETIRDEDLVWHLGDVGDWRRVADLPGVKHLIFGNCDRRRQAIATSDIFASTATRQIIDAVSGPVLLVHDPAHAADHGGPVIHGHLHARPSPGPRFTSVSVDQHLWSPTPAADLMRG